VNLWEEIKKLEGKTLFTLDRKSPFEIRYVSNIKVILRTSTGKDRPLLWTELEQAWKHLEKHKKLTRREIREYEYSNFNPAYVASILANISGITHSNKPITLYLQR
jgi:hypothetical protein